MTTSREAAARARAAGMREDRRSLIAALEEERRGYVSRGLTKRVKAVDGQLAELRAEQDADEDDAPADDDAAAQAAAAAATRGRGSTKEALALVDGDGKVRTAGLDGETGEAEDAGNGQAPPKGTGDAGEDDGGGGEPFDPDAHDVPEVVAYLEDADDAERQRVLDAERAGQARKGILGD